MAEERKTFSSDNELLDRQMETLYTDSVSVNQSVYQMRHDLPLSWEEDGYTVTRSTAWSGPGCHEGCGVLLYVNKETGKLEKVEGDPEHPYNQGHLCPRCVCLPETVYHPDRIIHPMIRDPKDRGKNTWKQVTWDEAVDYIEDHLRPIIDKYGHHSIIMFRGTGRDVMWQPETMGFALGSPHITGTNSGNSCFVPRAAMYSLTMGAYVVADCSQHHPDRYDHPGYKVPERIFVWGNNPLIANPDWFFGDWLVQCMKRGTKIVSIDPRLTWLSAKAELWLQIRPGTDSFLALAMLKTIIEEDLYDHEFVEKWTHGFDELAAAMAEYDMDYLCERCWVPREKVEKAARLYAASDNAAFQLGVAIDMQRAGVACCHAIVAMMALCDNVDVPGGNIIANPPFGVTAPGLGGFGVEILEKLHPGTREKHVIGVKDWPLMKLGMLVDFTDGVADTMITDEPEPLRAGFFMGTNTLPNMGQDPEKWKRGMERLEFNIIADLWMTPTAMELCDVFLPVKTYPEKQSVRACLYNLGTTNPVIDPIGDCKSDAEIINIVGSRFDKEVTFETEKDMLNAILANSGMTYDEVQEAKWVYPVIEYRRYEKGLLRPDGQPGFMTPTGKIELYSTIMESVGVTPVPFCQEPWKSPYSMPELAKEYPFIMMSGVRDYYFHSEGRQIKHQREIKPFPTFEIHPESAAELGICDGDWCWIENDKDRCLQRAKVTPIVHRKMILADHGWWLPEADPEAAGGAYEWRKHNVNLLLDLGIVGETGYGADIRCSLCKVYKAQEGEY